jgi:hypothetical protein
MIEWLEPEVNISMKKKYSACLYIKLLKSYPISRQSIPGKIFGAHLGFSLQVIHS